MMNPLIPPRTPPKLELEQHFEIWDNKTGEHIKVGPDRDGLNLIVISMMTNTDTVQSELTITREQAGFLIQALEKTLDKAL